MEELHGSASKALSYQISPIRIRWTLTPFWLPKMVQISFGCQILFLNMVLHLSSDCQEYCAQEVSWGVYNFEEQIMESSNQ